MARLIFVIVLLATFGCQKGSEVSSSSSTPSGQNTPLHDLVASGDVEKVKQAIDQGADINATDQSSMDQMAGVRRMKVTALHIAARKGNAEMMAFLIKNGAKVDARTTNGMTPLFDAVINSHTGVVELLLAAGADVNAKLDTGETPLVVARRLQDKGFPPGDRRKIIVLLRRKSS